MSRNSWRILTSLKKSQKDSFVAGAFLKSSISKQLFLPDKINISAKLSYLERLWGGFKNSGFNTASCRNRLNNINVNSMFWKMSNCYNARFNFCKHLRNEGIWHAIQIRILRQDTCSILSRFSTTVKVLRPCKIRCYYKNIVGILRVFWKRKWEKRMQLRLKFSTL